jgi:hypothetical protein
VATVEAPLINLTSLFHASYVAVYALPSDPGCGIDVAFPTASYAGADHAVPEFVVIAEISFALSFVLF